MRNFFIVIFGPTAAGKTAFAEQLAQRIPAQIVNADLGQFYTPLSIGTAKPEWRTSAIAQHLFDIINEPKSMSVAQYADVAQAKLQEIWQKNAIPIIVGGSGYYLESLFFPPSVSGSLSKSVSLSGIKDLWQTLYAIDPARATAIHSHDTYRLQRALTIWYTTGKKPSDQMPHYMPPGSFFFVYLKREKDDLEARIKERTGLFLENGWLQEVSRLRNTDWEPFLQQKKLIGYDDILTYLATEPGIQSRDILLQTIITKTRQYAKRQNTFGKRLFTHLQNKVEQSNDFRSQCIEFNLTLGTFELYINQLLEKYANHHNILGK